jgi:hypothetical protein
MNDFEQKILNTRTAIQSTVDSNKFLGQLHGRVKKSQESRIVGLTSLMMVLIIGVLSVIELKTPNDHELFYVDETENYFETDFWTVDIDSIEVSDDYTEQLAYFLLDEGDFWDSVDLINELTNEKEIIL